MTKRGRKFIRLWRQLATVAAHAGRPTIALLPRFARLYFRDRYAPGEILRMELLERPRSALGEYISKERMLGIQARLNPPAHAPVTEDKLQFQAFCTAAGLPIPHGVAGLTLEPGQENAAAVAALEAIPPGPLFLKPVKGFQGKDVQSLDRVTGGFLLVDGSHRTAAALVAELAANPRFRSWMVQERVTNHAQVLAISPTAAVQCLRIVTLVADDGSVHVLGAQWRLAGAAAIKDNFAAGSEGNYLCNVTVPDGVIREAVRLSDCGTRMEEVDRHPLTGVRFRNLPVPLWAEASALACRAAALLPPTRTLGWDIALTPVGPVIIEANRKWAPQNLDGLMGERLRRMAALAAVLRD